MKKLYIFLIVLVWSVALKAQTPRGEELLGLETVSTANTPAITGPIIGSLFFDSTTEKVMMYTTTGWVPVGGASSDLVFDSTSGNIKLSDPLTAGNQISIHDYVRIAPVKQVTGSYTVTAADTGTVIFVNSATAATITLPSGLPVGFNVSVYQQGTGSVTFAGSGATVYNRLGRTITGGQYAGVGIISYLSNQFVLTGDLIK